MAKKKASKKKAATKSSGKSAITKTKSAKASAEKKSKSKPAKKVSAQSTESVKRKGKTTPNPDAKPVLVVTHDEIAKKAYEIWLAKGCPQGEEEANWLEAKAALEKA